MLGADWPRESPTWLRVFTTLYSQLKILNSDQFRFCGPNQEKCIIYQENSFPSHFYKIKSKENFFNVSVAGQKWPKICQIKLRPLSEQTKVINRNFPYRPLLVQFWNCVAQTQPTRDAEFWFRPDQNVTYLGIDRSGFIKKFVHIFGAVNYLDLQDYVLSNVPSSYILYEQKVSLLVRTQSLRLTTNPKIT